MIGLDGEATTPEETEDPGEAVLDDIKGGLVCLGLSLFDNGSND